MWNFDVYKEVPVELRFMPTWLNDPFMNRKLQRWFEKVRDEQFDNVVGKYHVPADSFNTVYLLLYISKHFHEQGIGMRQLMDYYYLFRKMISRWIKKKKFAPCFAFWADAYGMCREVCVAGIVRPCR